MLQRAISYFEAIVRDAESVAARQDLAACYLEQGDRLKKTSSRSKAYQKALPLLTANAIELGTTQSLYELAQVYKKLASLAALQNNTVDTAYEYYVNAITLFEMTTGYETSNLTLLKLYDTCGDFAKHYGYFPFALFCYKQALVWAERLQDTPSRQDLTAYRNKFEAFQAEYGKEEDIYPYPLSYALIEDIANQTPSPERRYILYNKLSAIAFDHKNVPLQLYFWIRSIALHETLVNEIGTLSKKRDLAIDYDHLASALWKNGNGKEALCYYMRAIEIADELIRSGESHEDRDYLGSLYHSIAYWYIQDKKPTLALQFERKAYAIWKELAAMEPKYSYLCDLSKARIDSLT